MAKSVKAPATPAVLVWARQTASMELEEVARRVSKTMTAERIAGWEDPDEVDAQPTIAQLRKLSEIYKRPLATFFLLEAPRDFPVPRDFRRIAGRPLGDFSSKLRFEIRAAQERRQSALQFYEDLEEKPPTFDLTGTIHEAPATLAARAREKLGFSTDEQMGWRDQYVALSAWKTRIEDLGVLVFQVSGISSNEMRGFSIASDTLPVMAVNRGESPRARIFSLMHELTHLMVRKSGVCDFNEDDTMPPEERKIEVFCNAVAAEILAPQDAFLAQPEIAKRLDESGEWDDDTIRIFAHRFHVSREFVVRRLLENGLCTQKFYRERREEYQRQYTANKATNSGAREKWGEKRVRILGDAYTRLTIDTYRNGHLTLSGLLGHLQIKAKHLPQLERKFGVI